MEYTREELCQIVGRQDVMHNACHQYFNLSKTCRDLVRSRDPGGLDCSWTGQVISECVRELGMEACTSEKGGEFGLAQVPRYFVVVLHNYDDQHSVFGVVPWKELLLDIMQPLPDGELRTPLTEFVRSGALDVARLPRDEIDCFYCSPDDMGTPPDKDHFKPRVHWTGNL